ncbi:MAG: zinc ABC transporter substrate-binding protein [Verrucomicrobiae bacterium]|nr:zinc ABC transporter substrate-binding protein [Verrucomicrobiae bacterium]
MFPDRSSVSRLRRSLVSGALSGLVGRSILPPLVLLLSVACERGGKTDGASDATRRPVVVATTTMLADMVRALAADDAEVIGLMAPGVDPHTYELPARAIGRIRGADVIVYNGLLLEGKIAEVLQPLAEQGRAVVSVGDTLPPERLIQPEHFAGHGDPHVWGDASLWRLAIRPVRDALTAALPGRADAIAGRAAEYEAEIDALDAWIRGRVAEVPAERRIVVTSHDAFNYFGRAYGFEVAGVQGISTATDAGIADIVGMADLVKKRGIRAIFVETSVSKATIERVARDAGVKIGGTLFSDSCGPAGAVETVGGETYDTGTYAGMMKHNVNAIVEALK